MPRAFYLEHDAHLIQLFRRTLAVAEREDPSITVARPATAHHGGSHGIPCVDPIVSVSASPER